MPAALQWTFEYSGVEFTSVTVEAGPAAAGKAVICRVASTSSTCVAVGLNQTPFSRGLVANLSLIISTASTNSPRVVNVTRLIGSTPDGSALLMTGQDGVVIVN